MKKASFNLLKLAAQTAGLQIVSVSPVVHALEEEQALTEWQKKAYAGEMEYMKRSPELLLQPEKLLPELKSIIVLSVHYSAEKRTEFKQGYGKVARYAWGRDYHKVLRKSMQKFMQLLDEKIPDIKYRAFSDSVPILERYYAKKAGLGFIGKNTMLIRPKAGSFFFLAEILTNLEIEGEALPVINNNCGACSNCMGACPTGAIVNEYQVDARKCISYLTIEKKGILNKTESEMIGNWLFGCDICQEVCPFNYRSLKEGRKPDRKEFEDLIVPGGVLSLKEILGIKTTEEFISRFAGSPIIRTKREGLLRNACIVATNTNCKTVLPELEYCAENDLSDVVKYHAGLALEILV